MFAIVKNSIRILSYIPISFQHRERLKSDCYPCRKDCSGKMGRPKFVRSRKRRKTNDGTKALKMVRQIKRAQEVKHFDGTGTFTDIDYDGQIITINLIPQGDLDTTRIGDKCYMTSFDIRGRIENQGSELTSTRIIVYLDKSGTQLVNPGTILQTVSDAWTVSEMYNADYRRQFIILSDRSYVGDQYHPTVNYHIKGSLKKTVSYNAGTTTILKNAVRCLFVGNLATATGATIHQVNQTRFT